MQGRGEMCFLLMKILSVLFSLAPSEQLLRGDQENPATFFYTERHLLAEKQGPVLWYGARRSPAGESFQPSEVRDSP